MANNWFIEETTAEGYRVIARDLDEAQALSILSTHPSTNRLEMWSTTLADSPKGFEPAAYKANGRLMIGNTLAMLAGLRK